MKGQVGGLKKQFSSLTEKSILSVFLFYKNVLKIQTSEISESVKTTVLLGFLAAFSAVDPFVRFLPRLDLSAFGMLEFFGTQIWSFESFLPCSKDEFSSLTKE